MTDRSDAAVLELTGGGVAIAGRPILRGVDLSVGSGDFLALMGANGSGKSTLVRALAGLRPLSRGSMRIFGTDLEDFRDWQRVGYVPQRTSAASGVPASVWEIVASGRLTRRGIFRRLGAVDREAIREALEIVGLSDLTREGVSTLSGGQQQRVLIARALASRPELFFLDEPTAGVDVPNQVVLADTLEVLSERGATIVLVAHELGPMARLVDRAVVMRDGRVAYAGPPLTDAEVHMPGFGRHDPVGGHHHPANGERRRADHLPGLSAPLDDVAQRGRR